MELSTFELLVKRIAPPPASATVARRVVQGYFLTLSNLEDEDFVYRLDFHISEPNPVDGDRSLFGNAQVFIDIAGANTELTLTGNASSTVFSASFTLPAKQTASIQLLPTLTPTLLSNPNPDLEVRGFVRLRLPATVIGGGRFPFIRRPQSDSPVKVLVNPEIRGTFLPNDFPPSGEDFDQINYPLAIASGKGLNELDPEPGLVLHRNLIDLDDLVNRPRPVFDLDSLSPQVRTEALLESIAQIEPTEENLEAVTEALSSLNIPIQMRRATVPQA